MKKLLFSISLILFGIMFNLGYAATQTIIHCPYPSEIIKKPPPAEQCDEGSFGPIQSNSQGYQWEGGPFTGQCIEGSKKEEGKLIYQGGWILFGNLTCAYNTNGEYSAEILKLTISTDFKTCLFDSTSPGTFKCSK